MKLKQKLIEILGLKEEPIEFDAYNSLLGEIRLLRLILLGEKVDDVPPGLLRRLAEQNQKIYWAVKDEESGLSVIDALREILSDKSPNVKRNMLRAIKKKINTEIEQVNDEIISEKIMELLSKHPRLSASDISIYTSTDKDTVLGVLDDLVAKGSVSQMTEGSRPFFTKADAGTKQL